MREFFSKCKREVVLSVIVSIITGVVIKAWDWIVHMAPVYGKNLIVTINNFSYTLAASNSSSALIVLLIYIVMAPVIAIAFISVIAGATRIQQISRIAKSEQTQGADSLLVEKNEEEKKEQSKIENKKEINRIKRIKRYYIVNPLVMVLAVLIMYIFINTTIMRPTQLRQDFEHDLTMIAPYVDERDILQLRSDWACMREKEDYIEIYDYINEIKAKYSLPQSNIDLFDF